MRDNPFKKMQCHEIVWIIQFERASLLREPNDFANFCKFSKIFVVFLHGSDPDSAESDVGLTFMYYARGTYNTIYVLSLLFTYDKILYTEVTCLCYTAKQYNKPFLKNCLL